MNYEKLVPSDSFIGQYMRSMKSIETATAYDFWCAVWLIGVACGKQSFVDRPRLPVRLNWYIILAADSGITRKSTAIRECHRVASDLGKNILSTKHTPEQIEYVLAESTRKTGQSDLAMIYPELVTIMGKEGYMASMPGLLTDLYDGEDKIDNVLSKTRKNVYISFISASTPTWLISAINPQTIEGGFASRVIFICDEKRKRPIAWPKQEADDLRHQNSERLLTLSRQSESYRSIGINPTGLKTFTRWYDTRSNHSDSFRSSFEAREDDHVLRLAACLAINDGSFIIQVSHIKKAIEIIDDVKDSAYRLFGGELTKSVFIGANVDKVRSTLLNAGMDGIRHNDLLRKVQAKLSADELKTLLAIMHELNMIQIFEIKGTRGRIYRATQNLEQLNTTSLILSKVRPSGEVR